MSAEPDFDAIARPYKYLEYLTLGPTLQRCRTHYLQQILNQKSALVVGDGDGRFLARLLAANPELHTDAVDTSNAMLDLLAANCKAAHSTATARLKMHRTTAQSFLRGIPAGRRYDLVVTHFFLDCLNQSELETFVEEVRPHLAKGALWVISDFRIPQHGLLRPIARKLVRTLYLAFRLLTGLRTTRLPDYAMPLTASGLTQIAHQHSMGGLLTSELWQLQATHDDTHSAA